MANETASPPSVIRTDRIPPYSEEAEKGVLGSILLDSMKVMDIVADVEDAFDISVPLNLLPDIRTIGDFTVQIQKLLEEGA